MIVRELLARFGVEFDDKGAKQADDAIGGLRTGLGGLLGLLGGVATVRGFSQFVTGQIQMADAVGDAAQRLGVGVEALQELRFAGEDVGMSTGGVDAALQRLSIAAGNAGAGNQELRKTFNELGVDLKDAEGNLRPVDDILMQVADGMGKADSQSERLRMAFRLFGREGSKFAGLMEKGAAGVEELRDKARELGGVLSKDQVEAADKADKALHSYKFALQGVKNQVMQALLPAVTAGIDKVTEWVIKARDGTKNTSLFEGTLGALGTAAFAALPSIGKLITRLTGMTPGKLGFAALKFGAIALAIDEIITTFRGGDTLIRRGIDALLGEGATAKGVDYLKEAFEGLKLAVRDATTNWGKFTDSISHTMSFKFGAWVADQVEKLTDALKLPSQRTGGKRTTTRGGIRAAKPPPVAGTEGLGKFAQNLVGRKARELAGAALGVDVDKPQQTIQRGYQTMPGLPRGKQGARHDQRKPRALDLGKLPSLPIAFTVDPERAAVSPQAITVAVPYAPRTDDPEIVREQNLHVNIDVRGVDPNVVAQTVVNKITELNKRGHKTARRGLRSFGE